MSATFNQIHKVKYTGFHNLVNEKLKKQPFGKKELARKIQTSCSHMYRVLQGERCSYTIAKNICDLLDIPYSKYKGLPEYIARCEKIGKKIGERALPMQRQKKITTEKIL